MVLQSLYIASGTVRKKHAFSEQFPKLIRTVPEEMNS